MQLKLPTSQWEMLGLTQGKVISQMSHKQLTEDMLLCQSNCETQLPPA